MMLIVRMHQLHTRRLFLYLLAATVGSGSIGVSLNAMELEDLLLTRRVDWSQAGCPGGIPVINQNIINVKNHGVIGNGVTDDYDAIQALIDNTSEPAVLFFPAGNYRIEDDLSLKSGIVIRGEGSLSTHLKFYSAGGCFNIKGRETGSFVGITGGMSKDSNQVTVTDASGFSVGDGGMIRQDDIDEVDPTGEWANAGWVPEKVVGQMVEIIAVNGNTLTVKPSLNFTFSSSENPEIRPVDYITRVGIEDLHLERINTDGTSTNNVNIDYAAQCWIKGVESDFTQKYHFSAKRSLQLEIRECYIHDALSKGDGGQGYGTSLGLYATAVLIEDNIFNELRHAMIIQLGGNGCVFGYNYAQRNYSNDGWDKTYVSVHGHYPYMNLFEGNIVGWIGLADYWGASGPGNTVFRNRVIGTDKHMDFGPYRGIYIDDYSHKQNIIGNELTGSQTRIAFDGHEDSSQGTSEDVLVHGNNVHGTITWDGGYTQSLPPSFYLSSKPAFFGPMAWPSLGGDKVLGSGTIPAKERFDSGAYITQPGDDSAMDGMDLSQLATKLGTIACGGCPEDQNGDDNVDESDLVIFSQRYGVVP